MDRISTGLDPSAHQKQQIVIFPESPSQDVAPGMEAQEERALEDGSSKVRKEVHSIAVWVLRFGAIVIGLTVLVRVWHVIGYVPYRWLSEPDVQTIDKMLFSSAFGGVIFGYLKEIMKPLDKK